MEIRELTGHSPSDEFKTVVCSYDVEVGTVTVCIARGDPEEWDVVGDDRHVPVLQSVTLSLDAWYWWLESTIDHIKDITHGTPHYPHNI